MVFIFVLTIFSSANAQNCRVNDLVLRPGQTANMGKDRTGFDTCLKCTCADGVMKYCEPITTCLQATQSATCVAGDVVLTPGQTANIGRDFRGVDTCLKCTCDNGRMKHCKPIATCLAATQSATCRADDVVLTPGQTSNMRGCKTCTCADGEMKYCKPITTCLQAPTPVTPTPVLVSLGNGLCRTQRGGAGRFTSKRGISLDACRELCVKDQRCVAIEYQPTRRTCEIHVETITKIKRTRGRDVCEVKQLPRFPFFGAGDFGEAQPSFVEDSYDADLDDSVFGEGFAPLVDDDEAGEGWLYHVIADGLGSVFGESAVDAVKTCTIFGESVPVGTTVTSGSGCSRATCQCVAEDTASCSAACGGERRLEDLDQLLHDELY